MSKRLQVVIPDEEYAEIQQVSSRDGLSVSGWVRKSIKQSIATRPKPDPNERIARVLKYAKHQGPTGDMDDLLAEIERGRSLESATD